MTSRWTLVLMLVAALTGFVVHGASLQEEYLNLPAFELEWRIDPPQPISIGDRLEFVIIGIDGREGRFEKVELRPLDPEDQSTSAWYVKDVQPDGDRRLKVSLAPLVPGQLTLPSYVVFDSSQNALARTKPLQVNVENSFAGKGQAELPPRDFLPPVGLDVPRVVWILGGAFVVFVLVIFTFLFLRKLRANRRALKAAEIPVDLRSPDQIAVERLKKIPMQEWIREGDFKKLYFEVSNALKEYFGARFRFDASEATTQELLLGLEESNLSESILEETEALFQILDRVKFTDYLPEHREASIIITSAVKIIKKTRVRR